MCWRSIYPFVFSDLMRLRRNPNCGKSFEPFLRVSSLQKKVATYAIASKYNRNRVCDCFGDCEGARRGVRFNFALAEYWTLSRRADTGDLRCAVAAERFLHGASERRRF
jgi:hypothetical protein